MIDFDLHFPRYTEDSPEVPIWCLTPHSNHLIHRFFDTSPLSPSGRYLAAFQLPDHDAPPKPGDRGNVVLVDLQTGEERIVPSSPVQCSVSPVDTVKTKSRVDGSYSTPSETGTLSVSP